MGLRPDEPDSQNSTGQEGGIESVHDNLYGFHEVEEMQQYAQIEMYPDIPFD